MEIKLSEDNKSIIINSSDTFYSIQGVPFKHFKVLYEYQKELISSFIKNSGHLQKTLEDKKSLNIIEKINKLMFKDVEENLIEELNANDIINLYFTSNKNNTVEGYRDMSIINDKGKPLLNIESSYISTVNGMDFFSIILGELKEREKLKKEEKKQTLV